MKRGIQADFLSTLLMALPTIAGADFRFLPHRHRRPRFYFYGHITEADRQDFIKVLQSLSSLSGALIQLESEGGEAITSLMTNGTREAVIPLRIAGR